jgi:hypothetical protein
MIEGTFQKQLFVLLENCALLKFFAGEQIDWPLLEMAFKNTLQENEKIEDYLRPDLAEVMPEIKNLMSDDNMHGSDEIGKDHEASRDLQEKLEASVRMLLGS